MEDQVKPVKKLRKQRPRSRGILSWAMDDRPREKLLKLGAEALSDSELLAIVIGSGWGNRSALDLAKEILEKGRRNWQDIGRMSTEKLMKTKGIGLAKAIAIGAAIEIGKRRQSGTVTTRTIVRSSQDAARILQPMLADHQYEVFCILYLNQGNRVLHLEMISKGGISGTVVDPRIIYRKALENTASSLLLCHNHPSGNLQPSEADISLTRKLKEAGKLFDISVLDHVIVSEEGYFSFADQGLL